MKKVIVVGSGNAALCAAIAAAEGGAQVTVLEKAPRHEAGGNSKYTAGAMRFAYEDQLDLAPLLYNKEDPRIKQTDFGSYSKDKFTADLKGFNDGKDLSQHQQILVDKSYNTMKWLADLGVPFEPIYSRQTFEKNGKFIFWGGLTLAAVGEGEGLVDVEVKVLQRLGGKIEYSCEVLSLVLENERVAGVRCVHKDKDVVYACDGIILGCGGFEANPAMREKYMGEHWKNCLVRGSKYNMGKGIEMALEVGACFHGNPSGCHAVPMDLHMPNYGNPDIPYIERKNYRKICYFLGVMLNAEGNRFVDEGINFRNYTYAQFGEAILKQPKGLAWQIFDRKVDHLLYGEYKFWDAHFVEADSIEDLIGKMDDVNKEQTLQTIKAYNDSVDTSTNFDPTILDGKSTQGLTLNKTNWAQKLDTPPFKAYPVACGITFTYGGLKVNEDAAVVDKNDNPIPGLYACGELVGGVFYYGYPGGSGLTSGAVFGKIAGTSASSS